MKANIALALVVGLLTTSLNIARADDAPAPKPADAAPPAAAAAATDVAPAPAPAPADVAPAATEAEDAIKFKDAELTSVIETLARQAKINFLMDPKVGFGQVDEQGKTRPQPQVSMRLEHVTPAQALEAVLNNHGLQLTPDTKTKIYRVTLKDPAAPDPLVTKVIQLKYAGASNIIFAVTSSLTDKRSKVVADVRTSQLVVVATDKEFANLEPMIDLLDKPTRQVLIEAQLIDISRNPKTTKGINWQNTLAAQNVTFGNGLITKATTAGSTPSTSTVLGSGSHPLGSSGYSESTAVTTEFGPAGGVSLNTLKGFSPGIGFLNADGVSATLSFLNQDSDAQVISMPRCVTLDNEKATLQVARAQPIFKAQASTQTTTGGSEVTYTNLGTILEVTPRITADDRVWMKIVPEVSSVFATIRKTVANTINEADVYDVRRIETQVIIPHAHTLVLGGLMNDNSANGYTKVPLLGDIPVLGYAFRHDSKTRDKRNLLIFITPTIIRDSDYQDADTGAKYMQSRPMTIAGGLDPSSAWQSGRPKNWDNPGQISAEDAVFDDSLLAPKQPATANP